MMLKKLLTALLMGLFLLLGTASVLASDDECKVRITGVQYDRDSNQFFITYDESADEDCLTHANQFTVISGNNARVLWYEELATGAPPSGSGFQPKPDGGKNPDGSYTDKRGNKWKKDPSNHGGEHWDVSFPKGGHINVMPPIPESPKWKIRGGKNALKRLPKDSRKKAEAIEGKMNQPGGKWYSPRRLAQIAAAAGTGYLIYKGAKTVIGIVILPTPAAPFISGLLLLTP